MTITKIITGGCSFSRKFSDYTWPHVLEKSLPNIKFIHTGYPAQGQEMIQKKVSNVLIKEIKFTDTNQICVMVMWSGTQRKSFYINNIEFIQDLINSCIKSSRLGTDRNFLDLNDEIVPEKNLVNITHSNYKISYNKNGGWYTFNPAHDRNCVLVNEYAKSHGDDLPATIVSLENIILLQNLCKLKNIKFYQSFFMSEVYNDILKFKDDLNINYLFEQLDQNSIISTQGIFDYLRTFENSNIYFEEDNIHPNNIGHTKWVNEVLTPKLKEKGFSL